jgi:flagellar hook-basal body complex protein FliE
MDSMRIDDVLAQMRATKARIQQGVTPATREAGATKLAKSNGIDFAEALKTSLDRVNSMQLDARQAANAYSAGSKTVDLGDVMVSLQKSTIAFQATVQVRNRLVSAYQEIMNMQI